jgi:hypothetical protein
VFSVKAKFPDLSYADIWTLAGCVAIEQVGGPKIPFSYGRTDDADDKKCPPNGRLPDAALGAQHLRDVFYRMGFDDKGIVALSGAHTLGSCHRLRSGFDGPWTHNPLKFDTEYFQNLLNMDWKPRDWDGPLQYQDPSGKLMMLPTDMALIEDESFKTYVEAYATDEALFQKDFAEAFGQLISLGCPAHCQPGAAGNLDTDESPSANKDFRDLAMHGSVERMKALQDDETNKKNVDVNSTEAYSKRTAMHKAAYFGHANVIEYLIGIEGCDVNAKDADGDTPLQDAARHGHTEVVALLLQAGADKSVQNMDGKTALDLAHAQEKPNICSLLSAQ